MTSTPDYKLVQFNSIRTCSRSDCDKEPITPCPECQVCYHCSKECYELDYKTKHELLCPQLKKYYQHSMKILPRLIKEHKLVQINELIHSTPELLKLMQQRKAWVHFMVPIVFDFGKDEINERHAIIGIEHVPGICFSPPPGLKILNKRVFLGPQAFPFELISPSAVPIVIRIAGVLEGSSEISARLSLLAGQPIHSFARSLAFFIEFSKASLLQRIPNIGRVMSLPTEKKIKIFTLQAPLSGCDNPRCEHFEKLSVAKPKICSRCRSTKYCNEACQREAWSLHKQFCSDQALKDEVIEARMNFVRSKIQSLELKAVDDKYYFLKLNPFYTDSTIIQIDMEKVKTSLQLRDVKELSSSSQGGMIMEYLNKSVILNLNYSPYEGKERHGGKREKDLWFIFPTQ